MTSAANLFRHYKVLKKSAKPIPELFTGDFILICLCNFLNGITFQSLVAVFPIYIKQYGGSTGIAGLAMAVMTFASLLSRPVAGYTLDKYGRKLILVGGLVLFMLPTAIFTFIIPVTALIIFRFIQGIGWGGLNTSSGTVASDLVPMARIGEGMGFYTVGQSLSMSVGPLVSLWLINQYSFRFLFIVCFLLNLISIGLALSIKYPKYESPPLENKLPTLPKTALNPALKPAMVVFLGATAHSATISFLPLFALQNFINNSGVFFTFLGVTTLVFRPFSGKMVDRLGKFGYKLAVMVGIPAIMIAIWILTLASAPWYLMLSGVIYGIGYGMILNSMMALCVSNLPESKRGAANAIFGAAMDTGIALGSVIWGVAAAIFGYAAMFRLTLIPLVIALVLFFIKKPYREQEASR